MTLSISAAYHEYFAATQRRMTLAEQVTRLNKAALFAALKPVGIALVIVAFDGAGDSGQIETITAFNAAKAETPLPSLCLALRMINLDVSGLDTVDVALPSNRNALLQFPGANPWRLGKRGWRVRLLLLQYRRRGNHPRVQRAPHRGRLFQS